MTHTTLLNWKKWRIAVELLYFHSKESHWFEFIFKTEQFSEMVRCQKCLMQTILVGFEDMNDMNIRWTLTVITTLCVETTFKSVNKNTQWNNLDKICIDVCVSCVSRLKTQIADIGDCLGDNHGNSVNFLNKNLSSLDLHQLWEWKFSLCSNEPYQCNWHKRCCIQIWNAI